MSSNRELDSDNEGHLVIDLQDSCKKLLTSYNKMSSTTTETIIEEMEGITPLDDDNTTDGFTPANRKRTTTTRSPEVQTSGQSATVKKTRTDGADRTEINNRTAFIKVKQ